MDTIAYRERPAVTELSKKYNGINCEGGIEGMELEVDYLPGQKVSGSHFRVGMAREGFPEESA